jgi:hypothetical protein
MAERKKPRRRITRGTSFTFYRDDKTGEEGVRCLFCGAQYPVTAHWLHVCPRPAEAEAQ